MYISLFLGVPMGVPIYNLWGARGVCSPQTTWSSSCSQNIWGVALWTWFLSSYRLLCRQKMTWFWHCHKHILVITQFDNHRHSYVSVSRYIYIIIYVLMKSEWYSDKPSSCGWCCAGLWRWEVFLLGHGLHFFVTNARPEQLRRSEFVACCHCQTTGAVPWWRSRRVCLKGPAFWRGDE